MREVRMLCARIRICEKARCPKHNATAQDGFVLDVVGDKKGAGKMDEKQAKRNEKQQIQKKATSKLKSFRAAKTSDAMMMPPVFFLAALQQTSVTRSRNAYAHLLLPPPASGPRICVH